MKNKNSLSEDKFRQKVDGFSLNSNGDEIEQDGYETTDQGVYSIPDYAAGDARNDKEIIKGRIKDTSAFDIERAHDLDDISWSNNNYDHSKDNNETNKREK